MANVPQAKLKFYKGYGENFKKLREMKGLTQKQLYDKTHISDKSISLIEKEKREPTIEQINIYSEYFGASLDFLTGRTKIANSTIQMVSEYTGLSEEAINKLVKLTSKDNGINKNIIDAFINTFHFDMIIEHLEYLINNYEGEMINYAADMTGVELKEAAINIRFQKLCQELISRRKELENGKH